MFQQTLLRPDEYDVVATPNLNGDYLSDACAAQVGGLGMAPGANIGDALRGFRSHARHRAEIRRSGRDQSAQRDPQRLHDVRVHGLEGSGAGDRERDHGTIGQKKVTYDLHRQMEGATKLKTSEFAAAIVGNMHAHATV